MATQVIVPSLGEVVGDVTILQWFKSEGEPVEKSEPLLEVEAQKVTTVIESPATGILGRILYEEQSKVPVTQVVAIIVSEGEAVPEGYKRGEGEGDRISEAPTAQPPAPENKKPDRIRAAPLARKIAESHGIDLSLVTGTGPHGTIMKKDVEAYRKQKQDRTDDRGPAEVMPVMVQGAKDSLRKEALEIIPISGVRRAIFDNMSLSLSQTAQLTVHTEACAGAFINLRNHLNNAVSDPDQKVSYNAILVKISAAGLRLHPRINASVDGEEIRVWQQVHIGVAMEANDALVVPVIRNPDLKTISEINKDLARLVGKTKDNTLKPDDLANGTFTISNLGFEDIDHFTPILRPPESAILGVGRLIEKPVVKDGGIAPEARIALSLTFDHRIIDGAPAARFLKTIKELLEDPILLLQ